MNIAFEKFRTRAYITKKLDILLLIFIISIAAINIPVNADSIPVSSPVYKPFDINDINDVEAPIIIVPESYKAAIPGHDYLISITVEDNKGLQDVSAFIFVDNNPIYTNKGDVEHKMTRNSTTGKYEYTLPGDQISQYVKSINFYFVATDLVGLKTVGNTIPIYTSGGPDALVSSPSINTPYGTFTADHIFGTIPGSSIFYPRSIHYEQILGEDIHVINPTRYPVIFLPTYGSTASPNRTCDYPISVSAEDNEGIQEVTIDYSIGDLKFHGLEMTKSWFGRYDFYIPKSQIVSTASTINYTITATNTAGLKTTTDELTIPISTNPYVKTVDTYKMSLFGHTDENASQNDNALLHLPDGVSTLKDVLSLNEDTKNVTVAGQVTYFVTDSANPVIQAIVDGTVYSLCINDSLEDNIKLGHQVILTGDYYIENGLPMLKNITYEKIIGYSMPSGPELVTIEYLKSHGLNMLGRFVKIKNVNLGTNNTDGLTEITDETGSISLYKSTYPDQVKSGDSVDLYAIVTCADTTVQLRTGTIKSNGYNIYSMVDSKPTISIASTSLSGLQTFEDYHIQATAKDNEGIRAVSISYTIGDKTISNQQMTLDTDGENYDYTIPHDQILASASTISFTITATDISGLSTSKMTTLPINDGIEIMSVSPVSNAIFSDKNLSLSIAFKNGGTSPKVTYTLKKDAEMLFAERKLTADAELGMAMDFVSTVSSGDYTAIVTIVRSEDGKKVNREWHFTISE